MALVVAQVAMQRLQVDLPCLPVVATVLPAVRVLMGRVFMPWVQAAAVQVVPALLLC